MPSIKTAVVILNWNGEGFLRQFLPGVIQHSQGASVIVADNASTDNSIPYLESLGNVVQIIQLDKNYGFTGGYNKALKQIDAEYFVLLNSDVEVTSVWIDPIIDLMDGNKSVGICQPKIKAFHQPSHFEYAGASGGFIDSMGYPFCRGRLFNHLEEDKGQYDNNLEVFWATGACMFIRADLYHQLGGLDENFFAHMEEIDLCWRAQLLGQKVMVVPSAKVYHVGGGTLPKNNPRKTFYNFRNNLMMLYKNLPASKLFLVIAIRLMLDGVAGIKFMLQGDLKDTIAVIKAHFAFYGCLLKGKLKRSQNCANSPKTIYPNSILWAYFIKGIRKYNELK
ncbi:MAG: glycosyltransferase family 2 protein [Bacteroidota bacterium]|jgi:GT2 family glycosyltransferase